MPEWGQAFFLFIKKPNVKTVVKTAGELMGNTCPAAPIAGEMTFTQALHVPGGILPGIEAGPIKYLLGSVGRITKGISGVFRDKKRIIPVLVISLLWLVLLLLPVLGVKASVINWLSFFTFARGGTGGGLLGMAGGLIGKGLFAYFVTAMILPLFSGGKPFAALSSGFKTLLGSFAVREKSDLSWLLLGAGVALIGYNFLTGNASLQNGMAGIAAFFMSINALAQKGGFLRGFIMSIFYKVGKGQIPGTSDITRIMAGWAAGFALGIPLSMTGISTIGYLSGIVLVLAAVVIKNLAGNKKEAVRG